MQQRDAACAPRIIKILRSVSNSPSHRHFTRARLLCNGIFFILHTLKHVWYDYDTTKAISSQVPK